MAIYSVFVVLFFCLLCLCLVPSRFTTSLILTWTPEYTTDNENNDALLPHHGGINVSSLLSLANDNDSGGKEDGSDTIMLSFVAAGLGFGVGVRVIG